jgi:excisionase family DNA binding protein
MLTERTIVVLHGPHATYISVGDTARELAVSEGTVRRYIAAGILEAERFGRTVRVRVESVYRRKQAGTKVAV